MQIMATWVFKEIEKTVKSYWLHWLTIKDFQTFGYTYRRFASLDVGWNTFTQMENGITIS